MNREVSLKPLYEDGEHGLPHKSGNELPEPLVPPLPFPLNDLADAAQAGRFDGATENLRLQKE